MGRLVARRTIPLQLKSAAAALSRVGMCAGGSAIGETA